jgi:hypothetical protein
LFILSAKAKRQIRYYRLAPEDVELTVRRPHRRFDRPPSESLVERVFEGEYYRFGKYYKKRRIEVVYEEVDRDTVVTKVRAYYF